MITPVASVILYPYVNSNVQDVIKDNASAKSVANSFQEHLNITENMLYSSPECEEEESINCSQDNVCIKRLSIFSY